MRLGKVFAAVLMFVVLMMSVASTQAAAPGRAVSGRLIFESAGVSCSPCRITLIAPTGQPVGMAFADSSGNFTFDNVPPGSYRIYVEIDGYEKIEQQVDLMDGFAGAPATVIISPKRTAPRDSGAPGTIDASEFLTGYPKKAINLYKKGLDSRKKGKGEEAIKYFEQAIEIAPNFYAAHNDLGMAYRQTGRAQDAEKQFLRAHELNRSDADPLINLTGLYLDENQPDRAVETGEQAVKANSRSAPAFFSLGMALYKIAMLDRAEVALKKALELAPKMFQVRLLLANVYLKQQRYDNLMEQLDRYLVENPNGEQRAAVEEMRRTLVQARQEGHNIAAE
jgi:Flp pilus assembly protein TadD